MIRVSVARNFLNIVNKPLPFERRTCTHKDNYTPWHIKIYVYVVQMHIKSEVKSFEVRVYQGFTLFSALFRPYGFHCRGV